MNNASLETADRGTHIKIVLVTLIASTAILIAGASFRSHLTDAQLVQTQPHAPVVKAAATRGNANLVR